MSLRLLPGVEFAEDANKNLRFQHHTGEMVDTKYMLKDDKIRMQTAAPFWSILMQSLVVREVPWWHPMCQTAATDGCTIYFNPLFMGLIGRESRLFVFAHEVSHIVFDTFGRRGTRDPQLWNEAADFVINGILVDQAKLKMPTAADLQKAISDMNKRLSDFSEDEQKIFAEMEKNQNLQPPDQIVGLYDAKYAGWTTERVYEDLLKQRQQQAKQQSKGGQKGKQGQKGQGEDGDQQGDQGENGDQPGNGDGQQQGKGKRQSRGMDGHFSEELMSEEMRQDQQRRVRSAVNTAQQAVSGRGVVPEQFSSLIDNALNSKISWRSLLSAEAMDRIPSDYSWQNPDSYMMSMGITMPGIEYDERLRACLMVDTSGSMSDHDLQKVLAEFQAIARQFTQFELTVIQCDAAIQSVEKYDSEQLENLRRLQFHGRGGTYYRPGMEWVSQKRDEFDWLVIFTDGGGEGWNADMRNKLPSTVWLIINNHTTPPEKPTWGRVIEYDPHI